MEEFFTNPANWTNIGAILVLALLAWRVVPFLGNLLKELVESIKENNEKLSRTLDGIAMRLNEHEVKEAEHYGAVTALINQRADDILIELEECDGEIPKEDLN